MSITAARASVTVAAGKEDAATLLQRAREQELAGSLGDAISRYQAAIAEAETSGESKVLAEAQRRLAVVRHRRGEREAASASVSRASPSPLRSGMRSWRARP